MRGVDEVDHWAKAIAEQFGPGWRVEREPKPPYGWNLIRPDGQIVASGSLDRLEQCSST